MEYLDPRNCPVRDAEGPKLLAFLGKAMGSCDNDPPNKRAKLNNADKVDLTSDGSDKEPTTTKISLDKLPAAQTTFNKGKWVAVELHSHCM